MLYLIDGYNLLFKFKSRKQTLKDAREFLIHALGRLVADHRLNVKLIFDSSLDMAHLFPSKSQRPPLEIIFAPYGVSADDYLIELISFQSRKQSITLVTSDAALAQQAKQWPVKIISIDQLIATFSHKEVLKSERENATKEDYENTFSPLFDFFLELFEKKSSKTKDDE